MVTKGQKLVVSQIWVAFLNVCVAQEYVAIPAWLTTAAPNTTTTPQQVAEDPVCARTQRNLDEDPLRRHCLRQCLLSPSGTIQPYFSEWEDYCRETSTMGTGIRNANLSCVAPLAVIFGAEILHFAKMPNQRGAVRCWQRQKLRCIPQVSQRKSDAL